MENNELDNFEFQKELISLLLSGFMNSHDGTVYLDKEITKRTDKITSAPEDILAELIKLQDLGLLKLLTKTTATLSEGISIKLNFVTLTDYLRQYYDDDYGKALANSKIITASLSLEGTRLFVTSDYGEQKFRLITFMRSDAGGLYLMRYVLGSGNDTITRFDITDQLEVLDKHKNLQDTIRKSKLRLLEGAFIVSATKESVVIKKSIEMNYGEFIKLINSFVE